MQTQIIEQMELIALEDQYPRMSTMFDTLHRLLTQLIHLAKGTSD